jgi:hypothetical protein
MELKMVKNYVYRMDHDTGFAPNTGFGLCTLCGCKATTVERWAQKGGWVIGIGGKGTHQPNKLIYAMEVENNIPYKDFAARYPRKSKYLHKKSAKSILVSRKFFYFGDAAIDLPAELQHIVIDRQGCKCISEEDVAHLEKHLASCYGYGVHGKPNNLQPSSFRSGCQCSVHKHESEPSTR